MREVLHLEQTPGVTPPVRLRVVDQPAAEGRGEPHPAGPLLALLRRRADAAHDVCWFHGRRQGHLFGTLAFISDWKVGHGSFQLTCVEAV